MPKSKLDELLEELDGPDISNDDLLKLVCQFVVDVGMDDQDSKRPTRARLKLEGLKLMADILRNKGDGEFSEAWLDAIKEDDDEIEGQEAQTLRSVR